MFSFSNNTHPEVLHSLVDHFFEGKKALVKQRLRDSMEAIVDDLFGELVGQVKEMLLPAKVAPKPTEQSVAEVPKTMPTFKKVRSPPISKHQKVASICTSKQGNPESPKSQHQVFAVKSAPGASNQPTGGLKRLREPVIVTKDITSPASEQGFATTLLSDHQTSSGDTESIIPEKKIKTELDDDSLNVLIGGDTEAQVSNVPAVGKFFCQTPGCGKNFKKSNHLKDHERTHSKVKPFTCKYPDCSFAAGKRTDTIRHIRTVHLKKLKPDDGQETPDPKVYLEVKQELLN